MRIILSSSARAHALAKSLRRLLRDHGASVRLGQCQAILAGMFGYDSWAELRVVTDARDLPASPFDGDCEPSVVRERRAFQATRLRRDCLPTLDAAVAALVVESLGATERPSLRPGSRGPAPTRAAPAEATPPRHPSTPREWLARNGVSLSPDGTLDAEACRRSFEAQLSAPWEGVDALVGPARVLALACALRLSGRMGEGAELLEAQSLAHLTDAPADVATVAALVARHGSDRSLLRVVEETCDAHAFVTTALARLLHECRRRTGVLAGAEFLWVRRDAPALWHALDNVGRRHLRVEGLGATAHMRAEMGAGIPLRAIRVDDAVTGVRRHLSLGRPEPRAPHGCETGLRLRMVEGVALP